MDTLLRKDAVLGGAVVAISLFTWFWLIPVGIDSPGATPNPALAPDFWPRIIVVGILLMGVTLIVQDAIAARAGAAPDSPAEPAFGAADWRVVVAAGVLAVYLWTMSWGGLVVPSILALAATMALHGERRLSVLVPVSVALPVVLYVFFVYIARMAIPLGVFERLVG